MMPIDIKDLLEKGTIHKKLGFSEEEFAKGEMEKKIDTKFDKKKLIIGYKDNKEPKRHEFDLVSEDESIVVEVKSSKEIVGRIIIEIVLGYPHAFRIATFYPRFKPKGKFLF